MVCNVREDSLFWKLPKSQNVFEMSARGINRMALGMVLSLCKAESGLTGQWWLTALLKRGAVSLTYSLPNSTGSWQGINVGWSFIG